MKIVIIGNSATAVGAVEAIREYNQTAQVLVISEEPHSIYSRPMLSHYLAGEIDRARLAYRRADFYTRHNVQPILNSRVTAIDPEAHTVHTQDGASYPYDKLLISTGGVPIVPPIEGIDTGGVFSFSRLDDVNRILEHIQARPTWNAVVIGGGMIGMKATDALMRRGIRVTMVELAPRILNTALDEIGSGIMTRLLTGAGVEVCANNTVTAIHSQQGYVSSVTLRDGREIPCDLLVFGIGVRPNADLAKEAGLEVNRGVVVDGYMRTSHPDIYAAGDVAEAYDLVVDMNRTVAIWPNAYRQGATAGGHMVGVHREDPGGVAMNTVEACGIAAMSIGDGAASEEEYQVLFELNERQPYYKRLVLKDGRLVGAILVGNVNRAGIYTGLIRNKIDVSKCDRALLSEHLGLLSLPDQYRKHIVTGFGIEV